MENKSYINRALQFISSTWQDETINLDKVANAAGFSNAYFDCLFAENAGKPVMEYVRIYKLIRSAALLRSTDQSILDIALNLGYANPENYSRAFKAIYEISPNEYRQKNANAPLTWKDSSTGTVIHRFETAYPGFKRINLEDLLDYLMTTSPIAYADKIIFLPTIDCAVYKLSDENEYVLIEEYRPEEICLTLFCKEENIKEYLTIAGKFHKYNIEFTVNSDFVLPEYFCDLPNAKVSEYMNYAYLNESIDSVTIMDYTVRQLDKQDKKAVDALQNALTGHVPISRVFEQKYVFGNYADTLFFGLFYKENLVGVAMPTLEHGRGMKISDIGCIEIFEQHKSKVTEKLLWSECIKYSLAQNAIPMNSGTTDDRDIINSYNSKSLGYELISRRYSISNI